MPNEPCQTFCHNSGFGLNAMAARLDDGKSDFIGGEHVLRNYCLSGHHFSKEITSNKTFC